MLTVSFMFQLRIRNGKEQSLPLPTLQVCQRGNRKNDEAESIRLKMKTEEEIELRNQAEGFIIQIEQTLEDNADKIDANQAS